MHGALLVAKRGREQYTNPCTHGTASSVPEVNAAPAVSDVVLSVGGEGDASPFWPPGCAELSGGESTWIATGFIAEFGDGLDESGGAVSELLPSCGMGGRVFSSSLKPYIHSSHHSVTSWKLGQAHILQVAYCIARSTDAPLTLASPSAVQGWPTPSLE